MQRLHEISERDIVAEGYPWPPNEIGLSGVPLPSTWFGVHWNSINGKKHSWESNDWVWCYSFKVKEDGRG